jgi:hypothetical protein
MRKNSYIIDDHYGAGANGCGGDNVAEDPEEEVSLNQSEEEVSLIQSEEEAREMRDINNAME